MTILQVILSVFSGGLVGLSLGLIGGGGSILAVPLLVYAIGIPPHLAIGTSAVAVSASALFNLIGHARAHVVKWPCALAFAVAGVLGASLGAQLGKAIDGHKLLAAFGILMIVIAALMLRHRRGGDDPDVQLSRMTAARLLPPLAATGFAAGALSGFFGIGGGFLIVPGLITATAMPLLNAIGSSLVSVAAFGAATAVSYALSGLVNWTVATLFVGGGLLGGMAGIALSKRLAARKRALNLLFSAVVALVGLYVLIRA
jgi:uncharacterized protein